MEYNSLSDQGTPSKFSTLISSSKDQTYDSFDSISENEFNKMQNDILKAGKKLEPLINQYARNHKMGNSFLPILDLFDLFKRELKMNLIIRQNLLRERSKYQETSEKLKNFEKQHFLFIKMISDLFSVNISSYDDVIEVLKKQSKLVKQNAIFEQKKKKIIQVVDSLKLENEKLVNQNRQIKEQYNIQDSQRSLEMAQLLSKNELYEQKIFSLNSQILKLQTYQKQLEVKLSNSTTEKNIELKKINDKLLKKKEKIKTIKEENSNNATKLNEVQTKLKIAEELNKEMESKNKELKEALDEHRNKLKTNSNELESLRSKIKQVQSIESEFSKLKQMNKEYQNQIDENKKCKSLLDETKTAFFALKKKTNHFRSLCKELSEKLEEKITQQKESNTVITKLKTQINSLENIHNQTMKEIQDQYYVESQTTNEKLSMLEDKFHNIQKNYTYCAAENKRLVFQLRQASVDIDRLESENAVLQTKLESYENDIKQGTETSPVAYDDESLSNLCL